MDTSTIVCDLDGNGVVALYVRYPAASVAMDAKNGVFIRTEDGFFVSPACIKYIQEGRKSLPVSSSPSSLALAEHGSLVSGVHQ